MSRQKLVFYLVSPFNAPYTCNFTQCWWFSAFARCHNNYGRSCYAVTLQILIRYLKQEEMKAQLKAGLASLPAPSNDFEIVLPEVSCHNLRTV